MFKKLISKIKDVIEDRFCFLGSTTIGPWSFFSPKAIERELLKEEMESTPKFDSNCREFQCVLFDGKIWNADKDILEKLGLKDGQVVDAKTLIEIIQESKTKLEELAT